MRIKRTIQKYFRLWPNTARLKFVFPFLFILSLLPVQAQDFISKGIPPKYIPDTRIDNMGYWRRMAELGLVPVEAVKPSPAFIKRSPKLSAPGIATYDSPDVPVTETNSLQSENSIFVDPENSLNLLNSNNSHPAPYIGTQFGADALQSSNGGLTWEGTIQGAGGYNLGDPATAINRNGRMFVGSIFSGGGQGISYSDDQGQTWKKRGVASAPSGLGSILDKNHLWIDNSITSSFNGYLYDGWTVFGSSTVQGQVQVSRSTDEGLGWQSPVTISSAVLAGSHNQGINLNTGPSGEVYAAWAVYDSWPGNENAIGFARSLNGGSTWEPAKRIINNISGIRTQGVNKLMRVNSFPSMAVDNSNGPDRGSVYVVWANFGDPALNTGNSIDIYLMKSVDNGDTWSEPLRINQDAAGQSKQHYFPWISCDPDNGNLAVVFYDDRNVPEDMCETWVAVSKNGGISWQDFRISDVAFTPEPLTGLSDNYFGDYLGITSKGGMVYPCWTDNRTGEAMGYVSPFRIGPPPGQSYIDYYTHMINDSLTGNGNSRAESGETIALSLTMRNIGDQPDSAVLVTVSCESEFLQILNNSSVFGDFAAGQMKNIPQAFTIRVSDSIPDNYELILTLTATDKYDSTYLSSLIIHSHAAHLSIGPMFIKDPEGNGNNQLDPGETALLGSILSNTGDFAVTSTQSRLSTSQDFCEINNPVVNSGFLAPGETDTIYWSVTIAESVPAGTSIGFTDSLQFGFQASEKLFLKKIGVLTEDWESGNLSKMAWKTGGNKSWNINNFKVYEGTYSLRSGYINSLDTSYLSIILNLVADDSISFYRKVSSELSYDFLSFYIDNLKVGQWSGEKDWARVSFPVPPGKHTVKWEYTKDIGLNIGYDAAWIDFIEFPVQQQSILDAGIDASVCEGGSFKPDITATNYQSLSWSTSGSGLFNDPTIFNPNYYPSAADNEAGTVQLIISLTGVSFGEILSDTIVLTIVPKPTVNAGFDTFTCTGETFLATATATNYQSVHWLTHGDGEFSNPDSLNTAYSPGPIEIHNGKAMLIVKATPDNTCQPAADTLLLNIYPGFTAALSGDTTLCRGDTAYLKLALTGSGPWRIYLSDGNTINLLKPLLIIPVTPDKTTIYQVDSITNSMGCLSRKAIKAVVTVLQPPDITMAGPTQSCNGRQVIIQANADSVAEYYWSTGGASTPFITIITNGSPGEAMLYKVQTTGANGCKSSDSLEIKLIANCEDKKAGDMDVSYYPNPTSGKFTLLLSSVNLEEAEVKINTIDNKLVYSLENIEVYGIATLNINLDAYSQGTYILNVKCRSGELKEKLILKK